MLNVLPLLPPIPECLVGDGGEGSFVGPWLHGVNRRAFDSDCAGDFLGEAGEHNCNAVSAFVLHDGIPKTEVQTFDPASAACVDGVSAIVEEMMVQIDVHRADIGAIPAEG